MKIKNNNWEKELNKSKYNLTTKQVNILSAIATEEIKSALKEQETELIKKLAYKHLQGLKLTVESALKSQREEIIKILTKAEINCSGSCGAGCEIAVEKLIKKIETTP